MASSLWLPAPTEHTPSTDPQAPCTPAFCPQVSLTYGRVPPAVGTRHLWDSADQPSASCTPTALVGFTPHTQVSPVDLDPQCPQWGPP